MQHSPGILGSSRIIKWLSENPPRHVPKPTLVPVVIYYHTRYPTVKIQVGTNVPPTWSRLTPRSDAQPHRGFLTLDWAQISSSLQWRELGSKCLPVRGRTTPFRKLQPYSRSSKAY